MSLASITGKLSRTEMKKIMAGSGGGDAGNCTSDSDCGTKTQTCSGGTTITTQGRCYANPGATQKTCHYGGCPS